MFLTRTEYDRGVNTFSPEGRLFQVEYAIEAIKDTFILIYIWVQLQLGLRPRKEWFLLLRSALLRHFCEPSSVEKIMEIDAHIGCAMSGLIADARTLVEHARVETQVLIW
ncbi:Proteasome subunit alpha type-5-A [Castilleja foliolosa]|uniref:Proteasome subunit alpha type n=1 Tax=Castilleja foliolosa TaxID=1961234 RepID=A0ABD3C119_9LAMI